MKKDVTKPVETLVILQPLFLPWLGMFDMMSRADLFVILDNVQFSRQSWQQRNRIKTPQGVRWLTVPVHHNFGEKIMNVRIDYSTDWVGKHLGLISQSYRQAPHFFEVYDFIEQEYKKKPELLCSLSHGLIRAIQEYFGIKTELILASELPLENRGGKNYVLDLCQYFYAQKYLNGPLGKTLYSPEEFKGRGVDLVFHEFTHPVYPQLYGDFASHLSVIDALFNCGQQSLELIYNQNAQI